MSAPKSLDPLPFHPHPHLLDYRSPTGSFSRGFKPMVHDEFITQQVKRSRYWARSMLGYHRFSEAKPNEGHQALAAMEKDLKMLGLLISQNVDVRILFGGGEEREA